METKKKNITFDDIKKANETIMTTDIKGKDYAQVNERIKAFRMVYPTGTIETQMINNANGVCVFEARIYSEPYETINTTTDGVTRVSTKTKGILLATGTAYEKENSTFINKTSYIENCETSAVGRALGMAGFGIDTSIASAEEVTNAINNQETIKKNKTKKEEIKIQPSQIEILKKYYVGENMDKLLTANKLSKIEDMTMIKASELIKKIQENIKKEEEK